MRSEKEIVELLERLSKFKPTYKPAKNRHSVLIQDLLWVLGKPSNVDRLVAMYEEYDLIEDMMLSQLAKKAPSQNCTHPVPQNRFGIRAMHSLDNAPLPAQDCAKLLDGPIAAVQADIDADCKEPIEPQ